MREGSIRVSFAGSGFKVYEQAAWVGTNTQNTFQDKTENEVKQNKYMYSLVIWGTKKIAFFQLA